MNFKDNNPQIPLLFKCLSILSSYKYSEKVIELEKENKKLFEWFYENNISEVEYIYKHYSPEILFDILVFLQNLIEISKINKIKDSD